MRVSKDFDSSGVYFLRIEEFEWRPRHDDSNERSSKKKKRAIETESESKSNPADDQRNTPGGAAPSRTR